MNQLLDKLERFRGIPVLIGVALIVLNFVVRLVIWAVGAQSPDPGLILFLFTDGNLLLHLGCVVGLVGVLLGDIL